jgi:hypothetical protein
MKKATITYTAPVGEAKTIEVAGTLLMSGKSDTIYCDDALMARLQKAEGMFKVDAVSDYDPKKEPQPQPPPKELSSNKGKAA